MGKALQNKPRFLYPQTVFSRVSLLFATKYRPPIPDGYRTRSRSMGGYYYMYDVDKKQTELATHGKRRSDAPGGRLRAKGQRRG
jgi:hypothetical protein